MGCLSSVSLRTDVSALTVVLEKERVEVHFCRLGVGHPPTEVPMRFFSLAAWEANASKFAAARLLSGGSSLVGRRFRPSKKWPSAGSLVWLR
jgi:hypothetical protein